jgi:putative methionine-R-sulfoxide reductase with GAF domain
VNWTGASPIPSWNPSPNQYAGFYIHPPERPIAEGPLLLGPFNGRPACQQITPKAGKGVCADAFVTGETVVVRDVHAYPGHIGASLLTWYTITH